MEKTFEIYFSDLNKEAQKELLKQWNVEIDDLNWDLFPLAILMKDDVFQEE